MKFYFFILILSLFSQIAFADTRIYFSSGGKLYNPAWTWSMTANTFRDLSPKIAPSIILSSPSLTNYSVTISGSLKIIADKDSCNQNQDVWTYPAYNTDPPLCGTWGLSSNAVFKTTFFDNGNTPQVTLNTFSTNSDLATPSTVAVNTPVNKPVIFSLVSRQGNGMMGLWTRDAANNFYIDNLLVMLTAGESSNPGNSGHLKYIFRGQIDISCATCTPGQFAVSGGIYYTSQGTALSGNTLYDVLNNNIGFMEREEYIPINFSNTRF